MAAAAKATHHFIGERASHFQEPQQKKRRKESPEAKLEALCRKLVEASGSPHKIDLSQYKLMGESLGKILQRLPEITHLTLGSGCSGRMHLSAVRTHCVGLRSLNLSECSITNVKLVRLKGLTELEELILSDCEIADRLDHLQELPHLRKLDLSSSEISDRGFTNLATLQQVQELNLSESVGTDDILPHVGQMTNLQDLNLSGCWEVSTDSLPHVIQLTKLRKLNLSACKITNRDLAYLGRLRKIEELILSECEEVTDEGLPALRQLPGLRSLTLRGCRISAWGLARAGLTALQSVDLRGCGSFEDAPDLNHLPRGCVITMPNGEKKTV